MGFGLCPLGTFLRRVTHGSHSRGEPRYGFSAPVDARTRDSLSATLLDRTYIKAVEKKDGSALLTLATGEGSLMRREILNMEYVIGRRGSLAYLDGNVTGCGTRRRAEVNGSGFCL